MDLVGLEDRLEDFGRFRHGSSRSWRSSWPPWPSGTPRSSRTGFHSLLTLEAHRHAATLKEIGHRLAALDDLVDFLGTTVSADMTFKMATVSTHAATVLDELTRDLAVGEHRKIDRGVGFMAVVVEHLEQTKLGSFFSVAHYYESQNDLIADPDMVFLRRPEGWAPISCQDSLAYRVVVRVGEDGRVEVDGRGQREFVRFANMWMKNVAAQQGIRPRRSR